MARREPRHGFTRDELEILKLRWKMMRHSGYTVEFESFDAFLKWARGKFAYGLTMERIDKHEGWYPENIRWYDPHKDKQTLAERRQQAEAWDRMMQPIRKKYAKELAQIESRKRQFFRYEHPDLVREGIVFHAEC
jgi:hypothetical protein